MRASRSTPTHPHTRTYAQITWDKCVRDWLSEWESEWAEVSNYIGLYLVRGSALGKQSRGGVRHKGNAIKRAYEIPSAIEMRTPLSYCTKFGSWKQEYSLNMRGQWTTHHICRTHRDYVGWVREWVSEWVGWVSGWVSEWVSEWMSGTHLSRRESKPNPKLFANLRFAHRRYMRCSICSKDATQRTYTYYLRDIFFGKVLLFLCVLCSISQPWTLLRTFCPSRWY